MMAHGSSTSRHGQYDAFRKELTAKHATDELRSQSVFSYDGPEDDNRPRENPMIGRQLSANRCTMKARGVIPNGPVLALHMFDIPSESHRPDSAQLQGRSGKEGQVGDLFRHPHPPSTPTSQPPPGNWRRRAHSGQRPDSSQGQRPLSTREQRPGSSRRQSVTSIPNSDESLPLASVLRPPSSLGRYTILPSISPVSSPHTLDGSHSNLTITGRSDGSQRETDEMDHLSSSQSILEKSPRTGQDAGSGVRQGVDSISHMSKQSRNGDTRPISLNNDPENTTPSSLNNSREVTIPSSLNNSREDTSSSSLNNGHKRTRPSFLNNDYEDLPSRHQTSGNAQDILKIHHHTPSSSVSSGVTSPSEVKSNISLDRSHTSIACYQMDEDPQPNKEDQILIGIKIPTDGTRHKQCFNKSDQLRCIILFAEEVSGEDFSNHILVLTTPRKHFDNLSQTIEAAGLESKCVVHLEELD